MFDHHFKMLKGSGSLIQHFLKCQNVKYTSNILDPKLERLNLACKTVNFTFKRKKESLSVFTVYVSKDILFDVHYTPFESVWIKLNRKCRKTAYCQNFSFSRKVFCTPDTTFSEYANVFS